MNPVIMQRRSIACREFVAAQASTERKGKKTVLNSQMMVEKLARWKEYDRKLEQAFASMKV
jgi:hypothetical protein